MEDITSGVSQGSILGHLLFIIFLCHLFLEYGNNCFANYAYNTNIYTVDENTKEALTNLSTLAPKKIYTWLPNNQTNADHGKFHLLLSTQESTCIQIEYFTVKYCETKTLLGININNRLKFHVHDSIIGQKANRKLNALAKITNYMELSQKRILINAFLQNNLIITLLFRCCIAVP